METTKIIDIGFRIIVPPRRLQAFEIFAKSIGWNPENWLDAFDFVTQHIVTRLQGLKYSSQTALKQYKGEEWKEDVAMLVSEYEQAVKITHRILNWWPTE